MEWEDKAGAIDSNNANQTLPAPRSRRSSNERQPLLNNEDALDWSSSTERDDSYDVSNSSGPTQGEYQSLIRQRFAIGGLILCDMCRCIAKKTVAQWLPFIMLIFDPLFARPGISKPDAVTEMLTTIPVLSAVIVQLGCVFFGIASDAWIGKTRMLLIGSLSLLVGFCYISAMDLEIGVNTRINCTLQNHTEAGMPNPSCGIEPLTTAYGHPTKGVVIVYSIVAALIAAAHSLLDTLVPALAGDQVSNLDEARKLYTLYYWFWKLGDTISVLICLVLIYRLAQPTPAQITSPDQILLAMETGFSGIALNLGIVVLVSGVLSTILVSVVVFSKLTREPRPDVSIIVDSWGIWKQAWQRRRERRRGEGFLSTAMYRYGGDYPDNAVKERLNLGKFFLVLLCILPTYYLYHLPTTKYYSYNSTLSALNLTGTKYNYINSSNIDTRIFGHVQEQLASLLMIPIIYVFCLLLHRKCNVKVTLLHRLVAGQITMVVSTTLFFLPVSVAALVLTSLFKGVSNAFIWTAGYEIALVSAPRSMQATAMGMFYSIDGLTSVIQLIAISSSPSYDPVYTDAYYIVGIFFNICSIFLLILMQWKMHLGLSRA